jgi:serine/threonine-protein kinase
VVYAGTNDNTVFAFNAATGKQLWRRATTNGFNNQLVVSGGAVFVADGSDGGVYALDAATGRQLWRVKSSGVLGLAVAGRVVYAGIAVKSTTTGGVTALSAASGGLLWTAEFGKPVDTNGGLALDGNAVYATTTDGEIYAFSAADGRKLWRAAAPDVQFGPAPPVAAGGVVYACDGNKVPTLYAVHSATGREIWKQRLGASQFPAYLALGDGVVFAGMTRASTGGGDLSALNAATGRQLWKVSVPGGVYLETAEPNNVVYSGSNNGALDAWQANTGNRLWSYHAGDAIGSNIAVADGIVYFGASGNRVHAVAAQR